MICPIYFNDIVNYTENSVAVESFADNTKLYTVISYKFSSVRILSCLDHIHNWSCHWHGN